MKKTSSKSDNQIKRKAGAPKRLQATLNESAMDAQESAVAYKRHYSITANPTNIDAVNFADTTEFFSLRDASGFSAEELARLIGTTDRTIRTKRDKGETFDISQTERLRKLSKLFREGAQVLGSKLSFNQWLQKPAYALDNAIPAEILKNPGGLDMVLQEISAIKYGDTI